MTPSLASRSAPIRSATPSRGSPVAGARLDGSFPDIKPRHKASAHRPSPPSRSTPHPRSLRPPLRQTAMTLSAPFNAHRPALMMALALMMAWCGRVSPIQFLAHRRGSADLRWRRLHRALLSAAANPAPHYEESLRSAISLSDVRKRRLNTAKSISIGIAPCRATIWPRCAAARPADAPASSMPRSGSPTGSPPFVIGHW